MTDTTLSLAARLAANLFVDAIKLAKPGALAVAKIGDRALNRIGGPAFDERVAQRFLLDGADAPNKDEAQVDSLEPWYSDGGPVEWMSQGHGSYSVVGPVCNCLTTLNTACGAPICPIHGPRLSAAEMYNTMPNWQAPQSSAPVAPKPTDVAGSPEVVASPVAASGSPTWKYVHSLYVNCSYPMRPNAIACSDTCQQLASSAVQPVDNASIFLYRCTHHRGMVDGETIGLIFYSVPTKTPDSQGEQPVGAGVTGPGTDGSGLICGVMSQHWFHVDRGDEPFEYSYSCRSPMGELCETFPTRGYPGAVEAWQAHIAPLIVAALNTQK